MKIVYCIPHLYNAGGMERVLTQKANYLASLPDFHITIVTTEPVPAGMPVSYFRLDERVQVIPLNINFDEDFRLPLIKKYIRHKKKQKAYRHQLEGVLRDTKADICLSLCGKEIEWLGRMDCQCKKIAEIHFSMEQRKMLLLQYHTGRIWQKIGDIRVRQLQKAVKSIGSLVVLTDKDLSQWQKAGVGNTVCIPNPSPLTPDNSGRHDRKQVLAVGRLHPQKGFDMLIKAWKQVHEVYPDWTLRIIGEGEEKQHLEKTIQDLQLTGSIKLEGLSRDIRNDYQQSGVFVLSSRYEGMPLALMEAMSSGCCCIAFDCPEGPSGMITHLQNGILVENGNIPALTDSLLQAVSEESLRHRLGQEAYLYAERHFGLEPVMEQWLQLFETTTGQTLQR